jgi:hypothetical protein
VELCEDSLRHHEWDYGKKMQALVYIYRKQLKKEKENQILMLIHEWK